MTPASIENALRVLLAIGGSTNGAIHLTAIAGRRGIPLTLEHFNAVSADTPVLVNLKPVGEHYMEHFHAAGGVGALLRELAPLLHARHRLGRRRDAGRADRARAGIRRPRRHPQRRASRSSRATRSSRCSATSRRTARSSKPPRPTRGCWSTKAARSCSAISRTWPRASTRPDLDVEPDDVLVLQNAGPIGAGMPEAGYLPIPKKLLARGVRDMLRISDARMSGTAYGAVVLHVSPEAAIGGPLAAVRDGDRIRVSLREKRLDVAPQRCRDRRAPRRIRSRPRRRVAGTRNCTPSTSSGPERGCDFDFLTSAWRVRAGDSGLQG